MQKKLLPLQEVGNYASFPLRGKARMGVVLLKSFPVFSVLSVAIAFRD